MNNAQHFGLFPPTVPKIAIPSPHNKKPSLSKALALSERPVKSSQTEPVVIQINGNELERDLHSRNSSAEVEPAAIPASPIDGHRSNQQSQTPASPPPPNFSRPSLTISPGFLPPPPPRPVSTSLVEGKHASDEPSSPVVPMRSMFPTYNPSLPLSKQSYHPQRTTSLQSIPRQMYRRDEYRPRASTPSQLDDAVGGLRTAPASIVDFPRDMPRADRFTAARDLPKLWEATNGQEASAAEDSFDLEMTRLNEATFVFGPDSVTPFYTMQTFDTNEISIARTNPSRRTASFDILLLSLEPAARRQAPHDGLVTYIFPKLAAMLAIDQSNELAQLHHLAPTHRDEMQAAAVQRAANQEACRLYWREESNRYELEHPAIGRDIRDPNFAVSPVIGMNNRAPALHITVSSHNLRSPMSTTYAPPVIYVTNPLAKHRNSTAHSVQAGIRMSTLPQYDVEDALCSLDLGTMTLHIATKDILTLMPSLYAVDAIVSAVLAVAVADEATNPVMATMNLWQARPKPPMSQFGGSVKSYTGSTYYATLAEREEAEEEARLMRQMHNKDRRSKSSEGTKKGWFGREKKVKQKKAKSIAVAEFDLEKLTHYQGGDRKGQELPGVTKTLLEVVIWGLQCIVWMLTVFVKFLVWILINVSRALTSEKF